MRVPSSLLSIVDYPELSLLGLASHGALEQAVIFPGRFDMAGL